MPILTYEQEEAIHNFSHHKTTSINAFAGTGKTTTLLEIARSHNHLDGLYLAFNKSIANEVAGIAGKTSNLSSRTTHSMYLLGRVMNGESRLQNGHFFYLKAFYAHVINDRLKMTHLGYV